MLCDDAVENGALMDRNSLSSLVFKISKLYCSGSTPTFDPLAVRIRNDESNRLVRQGHMSIERSPATRIAIAQKWIVKLGRVLPGRG